MGDGFFPPRPESRPTVYAYEDTNPQYAGLLKIGYTTVDVQSRRDFTFHSLLAHEGMRELPLFSDLGEDVFIPTPEKEYPPVHFMEIAHVEQ